jgi:hypothetical protein
LYTQVKCVLAPQLNNHIKIGLIRQYDVVRVRLTIVCVLRRFI